MKNLQEEKLAILRTIDGERRTKRELNDMGINDYYIKLFIESEVISRISRGNYAISFTKNEEIERNRKMFQLFNRFKVKVLEGKYVEAYNALMDNYQLQSSHNYDNHMRIYFILLKELIGPAYDFSVLDELYEFSEDKNNSYYAYFVDFRNYIMEGNFYDAKLSLERYALKEKERNGCENVSTTLFTNMLDDVLKKIENSYNTQVKRDTFNENYRLVVNTIIGGDYQMALKYVENCIYSSKNEKMTNNMKRIRVMLNDIIELNRGNLSFVTKKVDYSKTTSIYSKLDWALAAKDYVKASEAIEEILKLDNRGRFKTIKRLVDIIISLVYKKSKQEPENNDDKLVDEENLKKMNSPLDSSLAYKAFMYEYKNGNYENALYNLEISVLKNNDLTYKKNNDNICKLLRELIDMEKNKHGFVIKNVDYSDCRNVVDLFNKALDNEDYMTAFKNSGKVTYQSTSKTLALFKEMLHVMYDIDKKYGSININTDVKKVNNDSSDKIEVTVELIADYIEDFRYDELYVILQDKKCTKSLNRLEHIVYKLIKIYKDVCAGHYEVLNHVYTTKDSDHLGRFFEAIRCGDIYEAYGEIACIYGNVNNSSEFEIFEVVLKDIIDKYEALEEENKAHNIYVERLTAINGILENKRELSSEDIDELRGSIAESTYDDHEEFGYIVSGILEFIELANQGKIDADYFVSFDEKTIDEDIDNIFMSCLNNGDYLGALKNINYLKTSKFIEPERNILRELLVIINDALNKVKEYTIQCEDIPVNHLTNITRFIEKYDFYAAFNYIMENNLDDAILYEIFPLIFDAMSLTLIMQEDMYREFYNSLENSNLSEARLNMINYKETLDKTSLGNIENLQEKYEEMKKKYMSKR